MEVGHCFVCESVFLNKSAKSLLIKQAEKSIKINTFSTTSLLYLGEDEFDPLTKKYLISRCPPLYSDFDFHQYGFYCLEDKAVIKFYKGNKEYFYQIRYVNPTKHGGHRYFIPSVEEEQGKPLYVTLGEYDPFKPTLLVEGIFTALVEKLLLLDYCNVLAVLGHSVSEYQLSMLKDWGQMNPQIFVHMDTIDYSKKVVKELKKHIHK